MRHLFMALYEGLIEHRRAVLLLVGSLILTLVVIQIAFYFVSAYSPMCGSCHIMTPYVDMWKTSTHSDVACVKCHTDYRYLLSKVYLQYALGIYNTQLRTEVPDGRCLSCHEKQDLDPDQPFLKNIHFSHKNHLGEMRRGKHLHCTSCHSATQMGQPLPVAHKAEEKSHVTIVEETCFICHFKGAEKGQAVTGCLVCHGPPKTVVSHQGFKFDHDEYLKRDVKCGLCHTEVTSGNANVDPSRCASCHVSHVEAYGDSERVHEIHLQEHNIDCQRCHNLMEHGNVNMTPALQGSCQSCHKPTHTPQEQMYIGIGGGGLPDMPSTMFLARVACDSCHVDASGNPQAEAKALRQSCVTCHGKGYDRMVDDWRNALNRLTSVVSQTVSQAERRVAASRRDKKAELTPLVTQARRNLEFVEKAHGEHNIRYAVELLRDSQNKAADALYKSGQTARVAQPEILASAAGYCRICHSTSHLSNTLTFQGKEFQHARHLKSGLQCDSCHSVDIHGKTIITAAGCQNCHHQEAKVSCETCHQAQAELYRGKIPELGISGDPGMMAQADVGCADCHDLSSKEPFVKVVQQACVMCHEEGYDQMAMDWIREDENQVQKLAVQLSVARANLNNAAGDKAAHQRSIQQAEKIYNFMLKAKGTHNQMLSPEIYDKALNMLKWAGQPSS